MQENRKVLITFDYELFLGKNSGTVEKCLIEPVDKIISIFQKNNSTGVFFVDATYLLTLKKFKHKDLRLVSNQIQRIIKQGSRVEMHLHPHWIDAYPITENRWGFKSFDKFRLHSLNENKIIDLFKEGKLILEKIIHEVSPNYRITGFRAGGWSILPFSKIKKAFIMSNIKYDFSVVPHAYKNNLPIHFYDFRNVPKKEFWRFKNDILIENAEGLFIEYPISTAKIHGLFLFINKILQRKEKICGNGEGIQQVNNLSYIKRLFHFEDKGLTIDMTSKFLLSKLLKKVSDNSLIIIVSHPKLTSNSSLSNLTWLCNNYNVNAGFYYE